MGKLNRLYERIFNSPRNFDRVSFQKTKHLLFQYILLAIIAWIIFFVVFVYDVINREILINNEIRDTVEVPKITMFLHEGNIDYFSLNNLTLDTDYNELNYDKVESCFYGSNNTYYCNNLYREENKNIPYEIFSNKQINIQPFNITFQQTYLNFNIQTILKNSSQNLGFVLYFGNSLYTFVGPMKIEILFKLEIINGNGYQVFKYTPNIVTTLLDDLICESYNNTLGLINNCSSNTLSVIYQSNIVPHYTIETTLQMILRILKDTFSIGKLIIVLTSLAISFFSTKFLFKKKTAWFDNSIRDAVLYHFHFHVLEDDKPLDNKKEKTKKKEILFNNNENQRLLNKTEDEYLKDNKDTMGSENKFKRLIESIPPQDKYSIPLSRFSTLKIITLVIILIGLGTFIAMKDLQNRLISTNYTDMDYIDIPPFNLTIKSIRNSTNTLWLQWDEVLPNGEEIYCKVNSTDFSNSNCNQTLYYPDNITIFDFPNIIYNGKSGLISVGRNEKYIFQIDTVSLYTSELESKDLTYAIFYFNDIAYYIRPYSNISIELTKSVFHHPDGRNITSYEPSFTVLPLPIVSFTDINAYSGTTYIYIWYSSNVVSDIFQETNLQLIERTATDFFSFVSPISVLVGLFFTKILVKFYFKYSTTHVEYKTREAIIYHLRNYEHYKPIFRRI
ncbi:hypothetical protein RB653_008414 [Dictyostelium firmibasis]|uniref:Transmembrane protein n=1 Tax=Dictyostelium firmibasis TaxID=79012 RepID=A0AAN7U003_9MYCE